MGDRSSDDISCTGDAVMLGGDVMTGAADLMFSVAEYFLLLAPRLVGSVSPEITVQSHTRVIPASLVLPTISR